MGDQQLLKDNLQGVEVLFGVLGRMLSREPSLDDLNMLVSEQVFTEVPFGAKHPAVAEGVGLLSAWTRENQAGLGKEAFDAVKHDYLYLFAGVGRPKASPWESTYFNEGRLTFEKQTLEVRDWYARYGLALRNKNREPDDNIGYELSFVAHLAHLASEAADDGDAKRYEEIIQALKDFLVGHPLRWASVWAGRVVENARSDFYRGLAVLSSGALLALASELELDIETAQPCPMQLPALG
ncbi:MAG: molecular chaperone [Coriobacteriia bacterium]